MSPGTIALIVVALSVAAWALFMANVTIRRQRQAAHGAAPPAHPTEAEGAGAAPAASESLGGEAQAATVTPLPEKEKKAPPPPLTSDQLAVSRRQFLNRAWTASFTAFLGFFGMSSLSFLWPKLTGGFGTKIEAGNYEDIMAEVGPANNFLPKFIAEGRFWLAYYDGTGDAAVYLATGAKDIKLQALYRKCVHLGCSVPHCSTSMLFECPCHGSKYKLSGEFFSGPAPRGLDRFPVEVVGGKVVVDTGARQDGPPRGTDTWKKFSGPQGAFCQPSA